MAEKREAFVGWMSKRDSRVADDGDTICPIEAYEGYAYSVPALVIPFDGDPPPMWPVGTKVRCDAKVRTIDSHPVLHDGSWWFAAKEDGKLYLCCHFEPVPPEKTWRIPADPSCGFSREHRFRAPTREAALAKLSEMLVELPTPSTEDDDDA